MLKKDPVSASCVLLVFLLLTPVSPTCRKGTANECKKAEPVPGSDFADEGFDINTLTMSYPNKKVTKHGACTLCENPLLKGNPLQRLPSAISDWKVTSSCQKEVQHSVHWSAISVAEALTKLQVKNDWRKELDLKIRPSDKVEWAVAGARSRLTEICIRKSSMDKYSFLLHHISCSYYKFLLSEETNDHFNKSIDNLPEQYHPRSKREYFQLITTYGTHAVTELDVGVRVFFMTPIAVCEAVLEGLDISELSRCLAIDLGVDIGLHGLNNSSDFLMCKEKKARRRYFFNQLRENRVGILGGYIPSTYRKDWLERAKSSPTVLSYSLKPLHTLVDKNNPRRDGLRQALNEYVREHTLWRNCTNPCPQGSHPSASDFCSCECLKSSFINSMCCAPRQGLAWLRVTIGRSEGLWGDLITRSDGYVSVYFSKMWMCTHTVWNENNPNWNAILDFGAIQLNKNFNKLRVQVWDEDFGWDDDLLGECELPLEYETFQSQICYLNHGQLHFRIDLRCGRRLAGSFCRHYENLLPSFEFNHEYYHY